MCNKSVHGQVIGGALVVSLILGVVSCAAPAVNNKPAELREHISLDGDWLFQRGDVAANAEPQAVGFDDSRWQHVRVPHDYILDGAYATNNARNHAYLPFEVAWYRKHFVIPPSDQGKSLQLQFDGIFRDNQVWLNGQFLGRHHSGYTGFEYGIAKAAKFGGDNVITVRVDPTEFEGWWYEGGGIYRHVFYNALSPVHVATFGTYVISEVPKGNQGADGEARITVQTTIQNDAAGEANCTVVSEIVGPQGESLATLRSDVFAKAQGQTQVTQHTILSHPALWSPESPQLYQLRTTILHDGEPVDSTATTFGIRTIYFDANKGFFLNGKRVEIHGVANHQDFPGVGIAVPDSLQPWRIAQLKRMGCNGWRTAHNPPNESVLDACDRLGMLVMDENRHLGDT